MQDICVDKEDHVCKNTKCAPIHFGKACMLHVNEYVCKHLAMKDRHACTLAWDRTMCAHVCMLVWDRLVAICACSLGSFSLCEIITAFYSPQSSKGVACVVCWNLFDFSTLYTSHPRQLSFLRKSDCLGCVVLLCLVVCLTLLASFFHLSLKHVYIYNYI